MIHDNKQTTIAILVIIIIIVISDNDECIVRVGSIPTSND